MPNPSPSGRLAQIATTLQGIVGRVLRIDPRELEIETPFLELGADSLALVEALRGLQESFGVKMTIRQLFEQYPSIAALAAFLDSSLPADAAAPSAPAPAAAAPPAPVEALAAGAACPLPLPAPSQPVAAAPPPPVPAPVQMAQPPAAAPPPALAPVVLAPAPIAYAPAPSGPPVPLGTGMERVLGLQIQAFNQLVSQQLQVIGGGRAVPAAPRPAVAAPAPQPAAGPAVAAPVPAPPAGAPAPSPVPPKPQPAAQPAQTPSGAQTIRPTVRASSAMNERQQRHLDALIERYTRKTAKSKEITQKYRPFLADSRAAVGFRGTVKEMLYPLARARAKGSRIWDVDGNEYIDVTMGMGVHLFGHHPDWLMPTIERQVREGFELGPRSEVVGEAAALFCELAGQERATFTNSGTEAVMTAIRLARAATGRTKIVMFAGSYHGHSDGTLAQTQRIDGELRSFPVAPGIPPRVAEEVLVLDYGSPESLEEIRARRHELAAVIVEPVQSRRPNVQPREFLHELRKLTAESGIVLIFDEMICGFRLHLGGGQAWYGIRADLATYGKIVGGGLPIGVVAGKAEYMDGIDGGMWQYGDDSHPERETTFFGGTFCQHPLSMAAAKRVLTYLKEKGPSLQEGLNARTDAFAARLNAYFESDSVPIRTVHCSSFFRFNFSANADLLFYHLVDKGIYVWEWRNCFLSTAHTDADLDYVVGAIQGSVEELRHGGFLPEPKEGSRRAAETTAVAAGAPAGHGAVGGPPPSTLGFWDRQGKPAISPSERGAATTALVPADAPPPDPDRELFFSLYFFGSYEAEFQADKYDLIFECARFADRHGFSALWFPERHFHRFGGISPNPSVLAAALARETERIALRAGSVVLPLHHPVRVAEEWAMVDNLSGGRVGLSYASGWHPNDFALAPANYGIHRERMFEEIATVERLWRGESVKLYDGAGKEVDLRIYPMPARRDLPAWITIVNNPDTYRRAGEMGAGVLTNLMGQTPETLAGFLAIYREALARAGHPPGTGHVTLLLHTFVGEDAEAAVETARRPFYEYLKSSVGLLKNMMASESVDVDFDRLSEEDLDYMLGLAYGRYVRTSALIGSPDTCAPIVERLREIGVDEIACLVDFGVAREDVVASMPWLDRLKERARFGPSLEVDLEPGGPPRGRRSSGERNVRGASDAGGSVRFPLTELQEDLYLLSQMSEEAALAYNEFGVYDLRGTLDLPSLRRALQQVVDRHEGLRTVFPSSEGQQVLPELRLEVPLVDATGCPPERRGEVVTAALDSEARRPFDFVRGPMFRVLVVRTGERSHVLSLCAHHIATDGISLALVPSEALAIYEASRAGRRAALPEPMQYREYAAWLQRPEREAALAADEAWWRERFGMPATVPPVFQPPTDRPRPAARGFQGDRVRAVFGPDLQRGVYQLGRSQGATFYVVFLALYTALLHRWTGQEELVVGGPTSRRPLEGGDRLVGHCVDLAALPTRLDLSADGPKFTDHLKAVRALFFDVQEHDFPFSRLLRILSLPRDASRAPLINVIFNPDPEAGANGVAGLEVAVRSPEVPYSKYEMALHAVERPHDLVLYFDYRTDLFDESTIVRFAGQLRHLVEGAIADPGRPVAELPLLGEAERQQMLEDWNRTWAPVPGQPVHRLFAAQAARRPDAPAVVSEAGAAGNLTYGELARRASRLAAHLRQLGAGPGKIVAIWLDRSPELVLSALAVLESGAAYLPIDPAAPAERLAYVLRDSGALLLLTSRRPLASPTADMPFFATLSAEAVMLEELDLEGGRPAGNAGSGLPAPSNSLAYVIYTSGSTGAPKGTELAHAGLSNLADWHVRTYGVTPDDRAALTAGPSFDASVWEMWPYLTAGASLHIPSRDTVTSPSDLVTWLAERKIDLAFLSTPVAEAVLAEPWPSGRPALRALLTGGDRLHRGPLPGTPFKLFNHYGPTECTVVTTGGEVPASPGGAEDKAPSIGRPIANLRVYVLDPALRPVPAGTPGELCASGVGLARGYLRRPALTAERFIPDPFSSDPGERLYRTGDLARWLPEGELEILGRADRQVKIRGLRIEPGEIEAALSRSPGVREAAVAVLRIGGEDRLAACLVPRTATAPEAAALRVRLSETLPAYMIPAVFVALKELPLTPHGKVDRRRIAELAAEGAAAPEQGIAHTVVAPRTPTEEMLVAMWKEILRLERVSAEDSFFAIGGHSLLATQVVARLRQVFSVDLSLKDLFKNPTVAGLAAQIDAQTSRSSSSADAELAALLDELDLISDEEAQAELGDLRSPEKR